MISKLPWNLSPTYVLLFDSLRLYIIFNTYWLDSSLLSHAWCTFCYENEVILS